MAKEKLEGLSTEKLIKRKKFLLFLTGVLIGVAAVSIALIVIFITRGQGNKIYSLGPGAITCFFFAIFFYTGIKKIDKEFAKRENA